MDFEQTSRKRKTQHQQALSTKKIVESQVIEEFSKDSSQKLLSPVVLVRDLRKDLRAFAVKKILRHLPRMKFF